MNPITQNLAVIAIVGCCVVHAGWQIVQAVRGRKSKVGSCCAKGCVATLAEQTRKPGEGITGLRSGPPLQFIPLESLSRKRPRV
jgi:hypothetical protein